ncbi:MAG TPA: amino acid adenylation domain-containing protein [Methylomirabilota bacterium]|nr:amino acid adenylation domain-containing protein [Methylomirabilota bacterium]
MTHLRRHIADLPPEQRAIWAKCVHPSGALFEFDRDEIDQSIPERFEKIVRLHPGRIAVKVGAHSLTYDELNQTANRIARAILDRRGEKQEPVVLLFEQGIQAITAMLGVLKAGKFYVAINPSFPSARITSIVEDSQASLFVTDEQNIASARDATNNKLDLLDIETIDGSGSAENLGLSIGPKDLASIMYTTGTTGQPKGVVQSHSGLLHIAWVHSYALHICSDDRLALLHSYNVGGAICNLFGSLLNGAALFPFDFRAGGLLLAQWLLDEQITICHSGPMIFRQMIDNLSGVERFPDLRVIRLSGMPITGEDVSAYKTHFSPDCILVHVLGTSEAGTIPHYFIDKASPTPATPVPVGYRMGAAEVLLLDDNGDETASDITGEIAIRSRYIAQGYWRKPALTKARFLPDPEGGEERICLTGDLGRMTSDGCLFHLARKDLRVKVRGYSVETVEVEIALRDYPEIKDTVVVGSVEQDGDHRLIAYVIPTTQPGPTTSKLRSFLKEKVPDYMIPSAFVMVDAMPLTSNGKIDRKALPAVGDSRPKLDTLFIAARTPVEHELSKIWAEVLALEQIGIHDNFFDLGGHSLRAMQIISRVRDAFQCEVPVRHFLENPTLAALAGYIESARLTRDKAEDLSIQPIARNGELPVSFAEQRLWFLNELEPGSPRYNVLSAFQLTGRLNVAALERSLNEIIRRHETLRTVFTTVDGQPVQDIRAAMSINIRNVDLGAMVSDARRDPEVHRVMTEEAQRPFALAHGPLIRATLVRLRDDQHLLLLVTHHIIFDGWSAVTLNREISVLYEAFSTGKPSPLGELPIQYSDFAVWQRIQLQGAVLQDHLAYWKRQLESIPMLQLPTAQPAPGIQSFRGARIWYALTESLGCSLKTLSGRENVTLFMTLLAAFQTLFHRYTGQEDIVIGSPVAGRNRPEIENLIGFFLNMLVLRGDLSGNPTFRELLARIRETCIEAYSHQDVPFEKLVEELQPQRHLNHNPLFRVSFVLQNFPKFPLELSGLTASELEVDPGIARFDLHLFMTEEESGLRGYVEYNTELFDDATIHRMIGHIQTLLESIVADPDQRIAQLPILTEAEKNQLLVNWNDTAAACPSGKCIHELFEAQVKRTPDGVAVSFGGKKLTYRELNSRSNQLAHYLSDLGVGPEKLVGICMKRSLEMIVGLLGILKAGGAYVPLDPAYPSDRLAFMLEDAQVSVLLTTDGLIETGDSQSSILDSQMKVVRLDRDWKEIAKESKESPASNVSAENLAYVVYTSGSTGAPNGVAIEHRNAVALLDWAATVFGPAELAGVLASTSVCFDLSVFELFAPLCRGGKVILVKNALSLPDAPERDDITLVNTTPSVIAELLNLRQLPDSVCTVNLAGEPLRSELIDQLYKRESVEKVYDLYGPSETTTYSTFALRTSGGRNTIGRPIAGTQIYVLDGLLQPVPIGVFGEIYIGGAGVARGYLNRPELSRERFISDPFCEEANARLYKTGDLARFLPDGNLEYLGRTDNQVKIRGYRIEPGEIEAVLNRHPTVKSSAVIASEVSESRPDRQMVAYVVPATQSFKVGELLSFAKGKLPGYMIPAVIVELTALPLMPNGKVNRQALPLLDNARLSLAQPLLEPRTEVEKIVAQIWKELLNLKTIGIHDNFFDLGGHSLTATRVVSRIRQALKIELPLQVVFEKATVEELAKAAIEMQAKTPNEKDLSNILAEVESLSEEETTAALCQEEKPD